jgi:hypothetical protein
VARHADPVRVYLPVTLPRLAVLAETGRLEADGMTARTVTPALRRARPDTDDEELEYAALMAAAHDSLALIASDGASPRRVVVAADVPAESVVHGDDETAIGLTRAVPLADCSSVHVDASEAEADVAAALAALPAAEAGDATAEAVTDLTDHELLWYATQEIADLLG